MKISNTLYDIIKYTVCIALPAIQVAILALANIFGWEWGATVSEVIIVAQTLIAALFCVSIATYKSEKTEDGVELKEEEK